MINDHRLGFPPVLLAFDPEPRKSLQTPVRSRLSEEEQAARRLLDVEPPSKEKASKWTYLYSSAANVWRRYSDTDLQAPTQFWHWHLKQWLPSHICYGDLQPAIAQRLLVIQNCPFAT